jgi:steroid 5-alpha reductase family enzyme
MTPPLWALVFALACGVALWLVSLKIRDVSIIDIFWGPGIAGVVDIVAGLSHAGGPRVAAVLLLVNCWALRLAAHIFARRFSFSHGGEDHRYAAMRRKFGPHWWWWSLVQVFLLQVILIWFIPAPLVAAMLVRTPPGALDYVGIALAAAGLLIESLADLQLARFRRAPANRGRVMDRGLWGWSRHPNYFGETTFWWGCFLIGFSAAHAWWLLLSPVAMTFLLLQVSGVTLMEDGIAERRPAYADYKRRVSAFVPLPARKP